MFFKLFYRDGTSDPNRGISLHGTVAADGKLYFSAKDVADILKYKTPYKLLWKKSDCLHKIRDLVYKRLCLPQSVLKTLVLSLADTVEFLSRPKNGLTVNQMARHIATSEYTSTYSLNDDWIPSLNIREAVHIDIFERTENHDDYDNDFHSPSVKDVLDEVTAKVLEMYGQMTVQKKTIMRIDPEWQNPPTKIQVVCANRTYHYKMT